ncbi:hypothetical protein DPMN_116002 [Dreissena polymorpha]|uniref:Uncharacterized protein n=1 Tax=Dreissena polymorpha TaxID=45954 RepID=A0A9D4QT08_DREPO|nr:hypothetical protein DPMN_116002 [Dreissena polymorpha]
MNLLTELHEDRPINVASRVKNAPPLGGHVFEAKVTIFEVIQDIIKTNLLTKFYQDWTINVASRVLTRKNAPPPGRPYIIEMNLLTQFNEDWTINVASRVLTRFYYTVQCDNFHKKNALPLGSHVFQAKVTISEHIQDISGTNLLSKFHEDRKINVASRVKNAPPPGGHIFQPTDIIFELFQDIIEMNLLTKFYVDRTINVASRSHIRKNSPPLGSNVFQANITIFDLLQDIIETNLLTKFHEDWTINANVEIARRTTDNGQKAITKAHHEHNVLR